MRSWKDKLTSRKFWAAVIGVVISVMVMFGADEDTQTKTVGVITASAVLVSYIVGEGLTDKAHVNDANTAYMQSLIQAAFNSNHPLEKKEGKKDDNNNS